MPIVQFFQNKLGKACRKKVRHCEKWRNKCPSGKQSHSKVERP